MPKGYVIVTEAVHDPEGMAAYSAASGRSVGDFGATVLVVDDQVEVLEGAWHGNRTVILEFEAVEKAREWYTSPSYTAARPLRQAAADCNVVIASGFASRPR
jgi:uncharacterized protein (DUF1330 family)